MTKIGSVNMAYGLNNRVNFGNTVSVTSSTPVSTKEAADIFLKQNSQIEKKPQVSTGKKIGVGLASLLCSGLGQAVNGQWGKAAGFFFGGYLAGTAAYFTLGPIGATVVATIIQIGSMYDAVKNAS